MTKILRLDPAMPCADLYLDDLEEIERIVRAYAEKVGVTDSISFEYEVKDQELFDSIEEVRIYGGTPKTLHMSVKIGKYPDRLLRLGVDWRPDLNIPSQLRSEEWAINAKVRELFSRRRTVVKDVLYASGGWGALVVGGSAGLATIGFVSMALARLVHAQSPPPLSAIALAFVVAASTSTLVFVRFRANKVFLRHSRADAAEAAKRRQEWTKTIITGVIGAVIGTVIAGLILFFVQRHFGLVLR